MCRWYVIQSKPREERRAIENLERQGFTCYLSTIVVETLRHGARRAVDENLFPGYLFIDLDELTDNWHPIQSTRGVIRLLRFREYPVPVPDEIMARIRQRLARDNPRIPCLKPGERVRVTQGPFAEVEGMFVAHDGQERVVLLMSILNCEQRLSFPAASVGKSALDLTL
jgi:transcriptional antiterminator RfaH